MRQGRRQVYVGSACRGARGAEGQRSARCQVRCTTRRSSVVEGAQEAGALARAMLLRWRSARAWHAPACDARSQQAARGAVRTEMSEAFAGSSASLIATARDNISQLLKPEVSARSFSDVLRV